MHAGSSLSYVQVVCSLNMKKEEATWNWRHTPQEGSDTNGVQQDCNMSKMNYQHLHCIMHPGEPVINFSSLRRVNRCTSRADCPLQLPQQSESTVLVFLLCAPVRMGKLPKVRQTCKTEDRRGHSSRRNLVGLISLGIRKVRCLVARGLLQLGRLRVHSTLIWWRKSLPRHGSAWLVQSILFMVPHLSSFFFLFSKMRAVARWQLYSANDIPKHCASLDQNIMRHTK